MNRLVLIDGNAILHRAYHALPPTFTAPDGRVVNAVYGFTTMLLRLITDLKPTHVAVAFDRPKPTFRKELFEGYQAKRPKMDTDLAGQIEPIHDIVRAFDIPIFEKDGYEADDVIGTLALQASGEVIIVTGDRDILQLVVDEKIYVYMPTKGLSEAKLYDEKEVRARLGVGPRQIIDFKALAGDNSDNYSGVPGVGPKTAVELIETFGSVEELYGAIDKKDTRIKKISTGLMEKLIAGRTMATLSKQLATIETNVPLDSAVPVSPLSALDTPEAREALERFGFRSILRRIAGKPEKAPVKPKKQKEDQSEQQSLF